MCWIRWCCSIIDYWRWPEICWWIVRCRWIIWWWWNWQWLLKESFINWFLCLLMKTYSHFFRCVIWWCCRFWFLLSLESWASILKPDLLMKINVLSSWYFEMYLLKFFHDEHRGVLPKHQQYLLQDNDYFEMLLQEFVTKNKRGSIMSFPIFDLTCWRVYWIRVRLT